MRRTARISAAHAPRGAGRIGATPGDERARTGITEREQQAAPVNKLAQAAARAPIWPSAIPDQSDWSPSPQVGQDSHGPGGRNHHAATAGDREAASAQVPRSLLIVLKQDIECSSKSIPYRTGGRSAPPAIPYSFPDTCRHRNPRPREMRRQCPG